MAENTQHQTPLASPTASGAQGGGNGRQTKDAARSVRRNRRGSFPETRREYEQKILDIRRVTRVVAGGRRFSFSVSIVIGNRRGSVGVGIGKASDTALAIEKATRDARKHMILVRRTDKNSIPHGVEAKYCASSVHVMPAPGRGIVAGSAVRNVLELAGVTDVTAKVLSRSKNKYNNAKAAVAALMQL